LDALQAVVDAPKSLQAETAADALERLQAETSAVFEALLPAILNQHIAWLLRVRGAALLRRPNFPGGPALPANLMNATEEWPVFRPLNQPITNGILPDVPSMREVVALIRWMRKVCFVGRKGKKVGCAAAHPYLKLA